MIADLPEKELPWLQQFFSAPNELTWDQFEEGSVPLERVETVTPWLSRLSDEHSDSPIILPFYRKGAIAGWYATTSSREGEQRLGATLRSWLGPSYLSHLKDADTSNACANSMRSRFNRQVLAFKGPSHSKIAERLVLLASLDGHRPAIHRSGPRPIGRIRSELERALLARDETLALALIAELEGSGRLNEENLRFLDIRLKAGLAQWEQIARDHWTIKNLADLPLPPQTLSDLIEALYRVYIDDVETHGDLLTLRQVFDERIAKPFPRLFASRHGVRTPRVVKAFVLHELLLSNPNADILDGLLKLLPSEETGWADRFVRDTERVSLPVAATGSVEPAETLEDAAQNAFEDGQYDRAFELYLARPINRKSISALLSCVQFIGTRDARELLLFTFDAQPNAHDGLPAGLLDRLSSLRNISPVHGQNVEIQTEPTGWMRWARELASGSSPQVAEDEVLNERSAWDATSLRGNHQLCAEFADLIGNVSGEAAEVVRRSFSPIVLAFFPEGEPPTPASKPIAMVILLLIAMDEAIARGDLEILNTSLLALLELGLTTADYVTTMECLENVQDRVTSYANLPWSLDICESLAIWPVPSVEAGEAKLRFFLKVVGQSRAFAHRLGNHDFLPIEYLASDYGVDPVDISDLRPTNSEETDIEIRADLMGKLIGIYTLTETAGARAKAALKVLFPSCTIEVNSDTVCTANLTKLARTSDILIFAWRSSSHQAFFCIKDALGGRDPVYAAGKGTASIVNAVLSAAK